MRIVNTFFWTTVIATAVFSHTANAVPVSSCPKTETVVSPDVTRQATTSTVGMISDRVSAVASGIGGVSISSGGTLNSAACGVAFGLTQNDESSSDAPAARTSSLGDAAQMGEGGETTKTTAAPKLPPVNGVWFSTSATWLKKTDSGGEFSGSVETAVTGYDRKILPDTVLGVAIGAETAYLNTRYNRGTVREKSIGFSPYVGYAFNDWLSIDATIGHAWVYYNNTDGTSATTETISDSHADRWFGSVDLAAKEHFGAFVVSGSTGYMRVSEVQKSYLAGVRPITSTEVNIGELNWKLGAGYDFDVSWGVLTPSFFARINYDVPHQGSSTLPIGTHTSDDTTSATFGVSVDTVIDKVWSLNCVGYTEEFRQNTSAKTLAVNARYAF